MLYSRWLIQIEIIPKSIKDNISPIVMNVESNDLWNERVEHKNFGFIKKVGIFKLIPK